MKYCMYCEEKLVPIESFNHPTKYFAGCNNPKCGVILRTKRAYLTPNYALDILVDATRFTTEGEVA